MAAHGELDLAALTAIDVHVHVESDGHGHRALDDELMDASAAYFRSTENRTRRVGDIAAHYRARKIAAVVFTVDAAAATGHPALSSEQIADEAAAHADVLIPFGSVDPHRAATAVRRARSLVTEHGVRGSSSTPACRRFEPNDPRTTRCTRRCRNSASPPCSTPARPASARACPAGAGSSCATPRRCSSTTSRPTSPS